MGGAGGVGAADGVDAAAALAGGADERIGLAAAAGAGRLPPGSCQYVTRGAAGAGAGAAAAAGARIGATGAGATGAAGATLGGIAAACAGGFGLADDAPSRRARRSSRRAILASRARSRWVASSVTVRSSRSASYADGRPFPFGACLDDADARAALRRDGLRVALHRGVPDAEAGRLAGGVDRPSREPRWPAGSASGGPAIRVPAGSTRRPRPPPRRRPPPWSDGPCPGRAPAARRSCTGACPRTRC